MLSYLYVLLKGKGSPYSIAEHRVPELIPVLGSQPAGDVSHKPGGRLPLLSTRPAVTLTTLKRAATNFCCLENRGTMGVNSLPKTVTRQHRCSDLNPGHSAPEYSMLTTQLWSHPIFVITIRLFVCLCVCPICVEVTELFHQIFLTLIAILFQFFQFGHENFVVFIECLTSSQQQYKIVT